MHLIVVILVGLPLAAGFLLVARRTRSRRLGRWCLVGGGLALAATTVVSAVALRSGLTPEAAVARWCDRHLTPAIRALESHRSEFGRYPDDGGIVTRALPTGEPYAWGTWPTQNGSAVQIEYVCIQDGRSYMLGVISHHAAWGGLFGMIARHWGCLHATGPEEAPASLPDEAEWDLGGWFNEYVGSRGRWSTWKDRSGPVPYSDRPAIPWWWPFR